MAKVLIIEDDPYVRRLYRRIFLFEKFEVEMAENGRVGLEKALSFEPTMIILDILMDEVDGLEVLRRLKKNEKTANIPVMMLTVVGDDNHVTEATRLGAVGYLMKSEYTPEQVAQTVKKYLERRHLT